MRATSPHADARLERPKASSWPRTLLIILVTSAVAAPMGALLAERPHESAPHPATQYHCPMHPSVVSDHPGECPICGMKLVPVEDAAAKRAASEQPALTSIKGMAEVEIDPSRQQLIGLRTALVDRGPIGGSLRTIGRLSVDETKVRRINVKVPGYAEHVFADFVGKPVRKGQPLFTLYSPEILAAEQEYLSAQRGASPSLATAARKKLELWDVTAAELRRLDNEGTASRTITIVSPVNGVVTRKELVEGTRLEAGAMPYEIVDLSTLWVLAEIYETELRFISPGMDAELSLKAFPGRRFTGKVLFVDPVLDPKTRTARVRLEFANASGELRPELLGEVVIERPEREVVRVPTDALVPNGAEDVVFVAKGSGHFEPRRVTLGEAGRDFTEVLEGLSAGDAVVTRANFLIDSESRLRSSLSRLSP